MPNKEVARVELIDGALYTLRDVKALTSLSTSTIYRLLAKNQFVKPVRIGSKAVRWKGRAIRAFIDGLPVA